MKSNEVKIVFDNKDDRDQVKEKYSTWHNGVYDYYSNIETEDDDNKFSITIHREGIEDAGRIGQDAKLYGATIQTSVED